MTQEKAMNDGIDALGPQGKSLPGLMAGYVERALPTKASPSRVRVWQEGRMRRTAQGPWLRFTAIEEFEVRRVGFAWRARFPIVPGLLWLRIRDGFEGERGRMDGRVWGLVPFMRTRGEALDRGSALRYLSELPWAPHAIVANEELEWREAGQRSVEVSTIRAQTRLGFRFDFDDRGDIVGGFVPARPRQIGRTAVDTPWAAEFGDYGSFGGIRVPRYGAVRWMPPEGPFVYWEGRITSLAVARVS
jgi:hypothetical protein